MSIEEAFQAAHRGHAPPWMWEDTEECSQCNDTRAAMLAVLEETSGSAGHFRMIGRMACLCMACGTRALIAALGPPQPQGHAEPPQEEEADG